MIGSEARILLGRQMVVRRYSKLGMIGVQVDLSGGGLMMMMIMETSSASGCYFAKKISWGFLFFFGRMRSKVLSVSMIYAAVTLKAKLLLYKWAIY